MNLFSSIRIIDGFYKKLQEVPLVILESQLKDHPSSKNSFVAAKPKCTFTAYGSRIEIERKGDKESFVMNPWEALKNFKSRKKRWLFGFFGYDLKNFIENLSSVNPTLADIPDMYFMEPEVLLKIDNEKVTSLGGGINVNGKMVETMPGRLDKDLFPLVDKDEYLKNVRTIKELIYQGVFYEMNYSYPLVGSYEGDPYWLYSQMRKLNPVPFGAFINTDIFSVCSASPERFLRKTGTMVRSEPIKGTAARSSVIEIDNAQKSELLNEKNRAENLMIVDLVRHDLSKVSQPGSVTVSNLYDVQTFGTVHQLISTIESKPREEVDTVDIIRSCFPMGSMTGAPKIEVMKTIDELEIYKRGLYSGAIGYFSPDGNFDFNVVIRTAILEDENLFYPVGGAITSDSDPELEWKETQIKSRSITGIFSDRSNLSK